MAYQAYSSNIRKSRVIQIATLSFGLTSGFIISRVPHIHRYIRLALYTILVSSMYKINNRSNKLAIQSNFDEVVLKLVEMRDLKKLYRAH